MPEPTIHPSREELSAYSLGQLPEEKAVAIDSHISECEPCCETIVDLSSDDTFAGLLQEARKLPSDQTVDHDGSATGQASPSHGIPAPLAEHERYEIVSLIGKGGMGDVYKAQHRKMERTVALKVINRDLVRKAEAVDRFHREVKAAAQLSHPNIVTAYDADQAGEFHFLVMEYVDGIDLARTVKDSGGLSITKACDYIRQAANGLQHAHERGMVHRDIKPHNLIVTADGTVKILDFGLASLAPAAITDDGTTEARSDLTMAGAIMGTPDFISPEQADDARQADIRSDIYSLGATLYFLLSGRVPFADGSVMSKLKSHAHVEPESLDSIRDDVPAELVAIVTKMMAKNPDERYFTPREVADALEAFLHTWQTEEAVASSGGSGSGTDGQKTATGDAGSDWLSIAGKWLFYLSLIPIALLVVDMFLLSDDASTAAADRVLYYVLASICLSTVGGVLAGIHQFKTSSRDDHRIYRLTSVQTWLIAAILIGTAAYFFFPANSVLNVEVTPREDTTVLGSHLLTIVDTSGKKPYGGTTGTHQNDATGVTTYFYESANGQYKIELVDNVLTVNGDKYMLENLSDSIRIVDDRVEITRVAERPKDDDEEPADGQELKQLQGDWELVSSTDRRGKLLAGDKGFRRELIQIKGKTFTATTWSSEGESSFSVSGSIEIDSTSIPKSIDFISGDNPDDRLLGIYEISDRTLKLCSVEQTREDVSSNRPVKRPTKFAAPAGSEHVLLECRRVIEGHDSAKAIEELLRRETEGLLSPVQLDDLVDQILEYQADRTRPWSTEMGDLIEKRWVAGELDRDLWEKYTGQFLVDTYELEVRPRIMIGSPGGVLVRRNIRDLRCGSGKYIEYVLREKNGITRVGSTIVGRVDLPGTTQIGHDNSGLYSSSSGLLTKQLWDSIEPGRHKITFEAELAILESVDASEGLDVFASRKVTFETETTFLPAGESTVKVNVDPAMKAQVDRSFTIKRVETGPLSRPTTREKYFARVVLDVQSRPIDNVFTIVLKDGENEYKAGSETHVIEADDRNGLISMAPIAADLSGKRIDVILRPNPDAAENSIDLFEIWGEQIVFKDVLVESESAEDLEREAAKWVLENGGTVVLRNAVGRLEKIEQRDNLPMRPFTITHIGLKDAQDDDLKRLEGLSLTTLSLSGEQLTDAGLAHLVRVGRLDSLFLRDCPRVSLSNVSAFRNVKTLKLNNTPAVSNDALKALKGLLSIQLLNVGENKQFTDRALVHIGDLRTLQYLSLESTAITDAGLKHLVLLDELLTLDLSSTAITDAGLKHLAPLDQLYSLNLSSTKITDDGLMHLAQLDELFHLNLSSTTITDAGLKHLASLDLYELNLDSTAIGDPGLKQLATMEGLGKLSLNGTRVTARGVAELRVALSEACQIDWESHVDDVAKPPKAADVAERISKGLTAAAQIKAIETALNQYRLTCLSYPSTEEGLKALIQKPADKAVAEKWSGPYLKELPSDPWGNGFGYRYPGTERVDATKPDIWSYGPDGKSDTDDDLANWERDAQSKSAASEASPSSDGAATDGDLLNTKTVSETEAIQVALRRHFMDKHPLFAASFNQRTKILSDPRKLGDMETRRQIGELAVNSPVSEVINSFPGKPYVTFTEVTRAPGDDVNVVSVNLYRNADGACRFEVKKTERKKRDGEPIANGKPITEEEVREIVQKVKQDRLTREN